MQFLKLCNLRAVILIRQEWSKNCKRKAPEKSKRINKFLIFLQILGTYIKTIINILILKNFSIKIKLENEHPNQRYRH